MGSTRSICGEHERADFSISIGGDNGGSSTIAEDRTGGAVLTGNVLRVMLCADDHHALELSTLDERRGDGEGVDEAGASLDEVKSEDRLRETKPFLEQTGGGGQCRFRGLGDVNQAIDVFNTGALDNLASCLFAKLSCSFTVDRDVSHAHAGLPSDLLELPVRINPSEIFEGFFSRGELKVDVRDLQQFVPLTDQYRRKLLPKAACVKGGKPFRYLRCVPRSVAE